MIFDVAPAPISSPGLLIIIGVIGAIVLVALIGFLIYRVMANKKIEKGFKDRELEDKSKEDN